MRLLDTVINYFRSSKTELSKVTWPSRQETIRYTSLVIGVSVILAIFFASLDFGLTYLVNAALVAKQNAAAAKPVEVKTEPVTPGLELEVASSTLVFPSTSTQP